MPQGQGQGALNDGRNSAALLDRVTLSVDESCFDHQPHGLAPSIARLITLRYKKPALQLETYALVASIPNFCALRSGLPEKYNSGCGRPLIGAGFKPVMGFHV
jgi:hypothetical protein